MPTPARGHGTPYHSLELAAGTDLVAMQRGNPDRYPFLLASTARGANGRYSILFAFPAESLELFCRNHRFVLESGVEELAVHSRFLDAVDHWAGREHAAYRAAANLPFTGGWFVYLGYELAAEIEPKLDLPMPDPDEPVAAMTRCPVAVIHDHERNVTTAIAEEGCEHRLADVETDAQAAPREDASTVPACLSIHESDAAPYFEQVARIQRYIVEGDIFQANLSRPWRIMLAPGADDAALFEGLARSNPGAFAALAKFHRMSVISSSPERLVSVREGLVQTRPIAGTRPRSQDSDEDAALAKELLAHPKEQAEHIMLIDLERNDLGRICTPGTIEVSELMVLESYQHVHHIVSNVRGRLQPGRSPADIIRAVFPGGTITGCPKVRCMEILAELEAEPRGAYTGSVGYINRNGDMDLNILIRTIVRKGDRFTIRAGGGIVADSDAAHELEETRAKAKGMLHALGAAA